MNENDVIQLTPSRAILGLSEPLITSAPVPIELRRETPSAGGSLLDFLAGLLETGIANTEANMEQVSGVGARPYRYVAKGVKQSQEFVRDLLFELGAMMRKDFEPTRGFGK